MTIDLTRLAGNFQTLAALSPTAICAPVIKGDAYGHDMAACAPVLWQAGARCFFVATLEDAVRLRALLPKAEIAVLGGVLSGEIPTFREHKLWPVMNDFGQVEAWGKAASKARRRLPAILHLDTGMNRLGLVASDRARLKAAPELLAGIELAAVMSHLCSADELDLETSARQRDTLIAAAQGLPKARLSLANSAGSYFGADYRLDLYRPGQALYGINPTPGEPNPVLPVAAVTAPLLQVKEIGRGAPVGYSQTWRATSVTRIATVGIGYANGYPRSLSGRGVVAIGGHRAPLVGRVSMDLLTVDVSKLPDPVLAPGAVVEIVGDTIGWSELAGLAGTIERDLTIALGHGCRRVCLGQE